MFVKCQFLSLLFIIFLVCCDDPKTPEKNVEASETAYAPEWKLGVAIWTFHTVDFPASLKQVDSTGIKYIEPNTFHKTGKEMKDSLFGDLSPDGIEKMKALVNENHLEAGSIYLTGGKTVADWKKQFEAARQFNVKIVTGEPPVSMWDSVDSLAGVYGMKFAIHEHWKGVSAYWHPDSVLAALKGHPNFGACADLGHWPKSGIDPLEAVKKLEGHILIVHLKDIAEANNPKLEDVRVGKGIVDFPAIFRELKRQRFSGFIYIERDTQESPSNVASVIETVDYYNDQMKKLQ